MADLLTPAEEQLLRNLAAVWEQFLDIAADGPARDGDLTEVTLYVHALQDKVMAQAAARAYPQRYRLFGGGGR